MNTSEFNLRCTNVLQWMTFNNRNFMIFKKKITRDLITGYHKNSMNKTSLQQFHEDVLCPAFLRI